MKAMILAAGLGTRLGPLTQAHPKPLLDVHGHPILAYILSNLASHGFRDVVINLHFHGEAIESALGNGSRFGVKITYIHEERLLGTAGSVKNAEAFLLGPEPFLVHYGDVITNQDLGAMRAFHSDRKATLTLLLHQRARSNSVACLDSEQRVETLLERPDEATRAKVDSPWVNSGVYLMNPAVLQLIPDGIPSDLPKDVFPGLIASRKVYGYPLTGYRCAIDSVDRLEKARDDIAALNWRL